MENIDKHSHELRRLYFFMFKIVGMNVSKIESKSCLCREIVLWMNEIMQEKGNITEIIYLGWFRLYDMHSLFLLTLVVTQLGLYIFPPFK